MNDVSISDLTLTIVVVTTLVVAVTATGFVYFIRWGARERAKGESFRRIQNGLSEPPESST